MMLRADTQGERQGIFVCVCLCCGLEFSGWLSWQPATLHVTCLSLSLCPSLSVRLSLSLSVYVSLTRERRANWSCLFVSWITHI